MPGVELSPTVAAAPSVSEAWQAAGGWRAAALAVFIRFSCLPCMGSVDEVTVLKLTDMENARGKQDVGEKKLTYKNHVSHFLARDPATACARALCRVCAECVR